MPEKPRNSDMHDQHHKHDHCETTCKGHSAETAENDAEPHEGDLLWRIEGMDCASCATTITTALKRLPGTHNIKISVMRERLSLRLDEQKTTRNTIEKTIAALGYKAYPYSPDTADREKPGKHWWQTAKGIRTISAGVLLVLAFMISAVRPEWSFAAFGIAALFTLVPIMLKAFAALRNGSPFTIEMLITIAVIGAVFIQATEEAAVVVFLFCVGELLEGVAAGRARAKIKALGSLAPKTAWREQNGQLQKINAADIKIGDIILARPGDKIAADGSVIDGLSSVNEALITGESMPSRKEKGDAVFAGSINIDAVLRIRVEKNASDNTIARIIELVENASAAKTPTERFIDSFSRIYIPIIVGIAILTALVPPLLTGADWMTWIYRALTLLLIGCPCALVISVPAAIASSLAAGAHAGLLIKGGHVLEALAKVNMIAFDKTGTLTTGEPAVTDVVFFTKNNTHLVATAAALERESNHPLATAIVAYAAKAGITPVMAENIHAIAGKGLAATSEGKEIFIGASRFAAEYGAIDDMIVSEINRLEDDGKTVVVVMMAGKPAGLLALRDRPRADAKDTITALDRLGIQSIMITGDNRRTARAISDELGITARAELLPDMKAGIIRDLSRNNVIAMVGDGINDAPALTTANVGIAVGSGTDIALETADAAILHNRMNDIPVLIRMARATMHIIRQNVAIALGLKLVFLVTTLLGISGLWPAILADTGATVLVTLNALRLLVHKQK